MDPISRRDFIASLPRWVIGGALAGGAVWLLNRGKGKKQSCTSSNGYCRQCPSNDSCGLPSAISFRKVTARRFDDD